MIRAEGREGERRETKEEKEEYKRKSWSCNAEASRSAKASYYQLRIELAAIKPVFYHRTYQIFSQVLADGVCVTVGGTMIPVSGIYTVCSEQQVCGRSRVLLRGFVTLLCWMSTLLLFSSLGFLFFLFANLYLISLLIVS